MLAVGGRPVVKLSAIKATNKNSKYYASFFSVVMGRESWFRPFSGVVFFTLYNIFSISKLPLWSVCMAGSQLDIGGGALWRVGVMLAMTLDFAASASILKPVVVNRYPHAAVAANGEECATVGRYVRRACLISVT